jgi:glucose-6-phosphate 1-epimerase
MHDLAALQRFAVPGSVTIDAGCGGLPRLSIATAACRGELYLHGAHVTGWQPAGQAPVLWMSSQSLFAAGKPIRGGIPVCWPWFGPGAAGEPAHGFARVRPWRLESVSCDADGTVAASLRLGDDETTRTLRPWAFDLRLAVRFGRRLEIALTARNTGPTPFPVGEALHTYLAVGDVRRVGVRGLLGAAGLDRVAAPVPVTGPERLAVAAETDLMFQGTTAEVLVEDAAWQRTLRIAKAGSRSTVVWNPWIAKAQKMPDFGDHEWPGMLCVEAANALAEGYELAPGAEHRLSQTVEVL